MFCIYTHMDVAKIIQICPDKYKKIIYKPKDYINGKIFGRSLFWTK